MLNKTIPAVLGQVLAENLHLQSILKPSRTQHQFEH